MIHIQFNPMSGKPSLDDVRKSALESLEGWIAAAQLYDRLNYNFTDKTDEEWDYIKALRKMLETELLPEKFKNGGHILVERASFMGEHICIYEGHILSSLQMRCSKCGEDKLVNWDGPLFCIGCQEVKE